MLSGQDCGNDSKQGRQKKDCGQAAMTENDKVALALTTLLKIDKFKP